MRAARTQRKREALQRVHAQAVASGNVVGISNEQVDINSAAILGDTDHDHIGKSLILEDNQCHDVDDDVTNDKDPTISTELTDLESSKIRYNQVDSLRSCDDIEVRFCKLETRVKLELLARLDDLECRTLELERSTAEWRQRDNQPPRKKLAVLHEREVRVPFGPWPSPDDASAAGGQSTPVEASVAGGLSTPVDARAWSIHHSGVLFVSLLAALSGGGWL